MKKDAFYGNPSSLIFEKDWNNRDPKNVPLEELDKTPRTARDHLPLRPHGPEPFAARWDTTAGKFGPFAGQVFVGDMTIPIVMRVTLEKVDGEYQGACYPFMKREELRGANRIIFAPDGSHVRRPHRPRLGQGDAGHPADQMDRQNALRDRVDVADQDRLRPDFHQTRRQKPPH